MAAQAPIPLHRKWTFYYENRQTRTTTPVGSFDTVQDFWAHYHVLPLKTAPAQSNLAMFKAGVTPSANDPVNQEGGRWLLPEDHDAAQAFTQCALSLIGENFHDGDALSGLVLSTRPGSQQVALWHSGALDTARHDVTLRELCKLLELRPEQIKHAPHREALAAALPQKSFGVRLNRSIGGSSDAHSNNSSRQSSPLSSPRAGSHASTATSTTGTSLAPPSARSASAASSPLASPRHSPPSSPLRRSSAVDATPSESDEFLSPFHELTQLSPERRHKKHHTRPSRDRTTEARSTARLGPLAEEGAAMPLSASTGAVLESTSATPHATTPARGTASKSSKHSRSVDANSGVDEGEYALPKRHRRRGRRPSQASDDFGSALHRRHQSSAAMLARHARHGSRSFSGSEDESGYSTADDEHGSAHGVLGIRPLYWALFAALIVLLVLGTYYYAEHVVRPQWRVPLSTHAARNEATQCDDSDHPFVDKPKRQQL